MTEVRTGRDLKREQTRQRIYEAALDVFRRDGVRSARIEDITRIAGVSRATFYFHFPTREDVLLQLLHQSEFELVELVESMPNDAELIDVLTQLAEEIGRRWKDDPRMLSQMGMVALQMTASGLPEGVGIESHPAQRVLISRFKDAQERGEISNLVPPEVLPQLFLVAVFGAAVSWKPEMPVSLEAICLGVVGFFLKGLAP